MALKKTIDKATHTKLPADIQKEYKADGENFILEIEGEEDTSALKRAKDHEKEQRKAAEKRAKDAEDQRDALQTERDDLLKGAIPKADVAKLETSYQTKLAAREKELTGQIQTLDGALKTTLVDNAAIGLASKLSASPSLLLPHIKGRLVAEIVDGKAVTKVVDTDGKPSALTLADLEKEILANKEFAPILTASRGSGGGAGGAGGGGAPKKIDFAKASPKEIAEWHKASGKIDAT